MITRRRFVAGSTLALAGCDRLDRSPAFREVLRSAETLNYHAHRLVTDRSALAREYPEADLSRVFRANGTLMPNTPAYRAHAETAFRDWRVRVDGLVARPLSISTETLRRLPARTQITRHDCVEGWSAIGKWTGPQLGPILRHAGLSSRARFIVFHCADRYGSLPYYESIDLVDAFHPQTILAWALNDRLLPIENGAPVRLRVEKQLGYKHAKYVERIEAVETLAGIHGGKGGFWEDTNDYEWYAGI